MVACTLGLLRTKKRGPRQYVARTSEENRLSAQAPAPAHVCAIREQLGAMHTTYAYEHLGARLGQYISMYSRRGGSHPVAHCQRRRPPTRCKQSALEVFLCYDRAPRRYKYWYFYIQSPVDPFDLYKQAFVCTFTVQS